MHYRHSPKPARRWHYYTKRRSKSCSMCGPAWRIWTCACAPSIFVLKSLCDHSQMPRFRFLSFHKFSDPVSSRPESIFADDLPERVGSWQSVFHRLTDARLCCRNSTIIWKKTSVATSTVRLKLSRPYNFLHPLFCVLLGVAKVSSYMLKYHFRFRDFTSTYW